MDDVYSDSGFITFDDFMKRLRADLNDPDFFAYDLRAPRSEEEYQDYLRICR